MNFYYFITHMRGVFFLSLFFFISNFCGTFLFDYLLERSTQRISQLCYLNGPNIIKAPFIVWHGRPKVI